MTELTKQILTSVPNLAWLSRKVGITLKWKKLVTLKINILKLPEIKYIYIDIDISAFFTVNSLVPLPRRAKYDKF